MDPVQSGMFPQSQMDKTQFATASQMPISREVVNADYDTRVNPYSGEMPRFDKGGHVGIKSLAKELPQYGRYNDDMVAHISSEEAAMLKAMGGAGTINPHTGLPEFGFNPIKAVVSGVKSLVQPVYNATFKNIPGVDQALVGLDKAVGNNIPGGWGTVAQVAGSAMGLPTPMLVGMGALSGSGALKPNGKFNLQGALMGGAAAYGTAQLGAGLREAGGGLSSIPAGDIAAANAAVDPIAALNASQNFTGTAAQQAAANAAVQGAGSSAANAVNPDVYSGLAGTQGAITAPPPPSALDSFIAERGNNLAATGRGIQNLSGLGSEGLAGIKPAATAFGNSGASMSNTALPILAGTTGLAAIDAQNQAEKDAAAQNATNTQGYNAEMAAINEGVKRSEDIMRRNPYQFASGGVVAFAPGGDVSRFLSGGGDGLSDDIPATIEGNQPARLADGEFVISADAVSALGGGSSKAGAKKLYEMMDRIREQAHGTKKQVRPINEKHALPV